MELVVAAFAQQISVLPIALKSLAAKPGLMVEFAGSSGESSPLPFGQRAKLFRKSFLRKKRVKSHAVCEIKKKNSSLSDKLGQEPQP